MHEFMAKFQKEFIFLPSNLYVPTQYYLFSFFFAKSIDFNVHSSYGFYLYFTKCNFNRIFNGNIHFIRQFSRLFVIFFLCVQSKEHCSRQDQNAVKTIVFFLLHYDCTLFVKKSIKMKIQTVLPLHMICMQYCDCFATIQLDQLQFIELKTRFACSVIYVQTLEIVWI